MNKKVLQGGGKMAKKSKMSCDDDLGQISLEETMGGQNASLLQLRESSDINSLKRKENSLNCLKM